MTIRKTQAGILTYRVEPLTRQYHCDLLLLQTAVGAKTRPAGDKHELFKLYARLHVATQE